MNKLLTLILIGGLGLLLFFFTQTFNSDKEFNTQSEWGYDLALTKTLSPTTQGPFSPWDSVSFVISVFNQWTEPSGNIGVTDYIPSWLTFMSSTTPYTPPSWWTVVFWLSNIAPSGQSDIIVNYVIDSNFPWGPISNYAEISSDSGDDIDSNPDQNKDNDCLINDEKDMLWCS